VVSDVSCHQPVLDELIQNARQLTDKPAIAAEVDSIERRWTEVKNELERRTEVLETALSLWTQYIQLVSHIREHLSNVSIKLQSNIRPKMRSADSTMLANVLQIAQVISSTLSLCIVNP